MNSDVGAEAAADTVDQDAWEREMEMMLEQRDSRSRSRSFIEMHNSSVPPHPQVDKLPRPQSLGTTGFRSAQVDGTSRARGATADDESHDDDGYSYDDEGSVARQAARSTKLYLAGSAPVDLDAIAMMQDGLHGCGSNRAAQHIEAGPLSAKALDILSQGLAMRADDSAERRSMTEEELEEKKMAEEEAIKLQQEREMPSSIGVVEEVPVDVAVVSSAMSSSGRVKKKGSLGKAFSGIKTKMFGKKPNGLASDAPSSSSSSSNRSSITAAIGTSRPAGPLAHRRASSSAMPEYAGRPGDQAKRKPYKIKLLLLGDSGVGKTSLMRVFSGDEFSESMLATAGVDFKVRSLTLEDEYDVALQIWDTAGQERFHRITSTYYKGANGIILVYDVGDKRGFDNVGYWMKNIQEHSPSNMPAMLLVGNKIDLATRVIVTEMGQAAADAYHCRYMAVITQKELLEREQQQHGAPLNKENCVIS
ncbi:hypothetical protein DYB34_002418 [Aphanomyces astaci]|uniref:Uncharacterized protein n=1 Tax=Aphanomyces astaci TaxID=112090 RepID=A0A397ERV7_APHAT|nr:hypothetical protein DYB36_002051 [Aphanomyces astaci]RHY55867.1 hypothetical protein DYB34_002418 [Aphanomyces astaci]RHZ03179.1 hypothetical protein DYB31_001476 [Aphanomyces astaci]